MIALAALSLGAGLVLVWSWVRARRFSLERRIGPRLAGGRDDGAAVRLALPVMADALRALERWGAPAEEIERRLARAGMDSSVARHRAHGAVGAAAGLGAGLMLGAATSAARGSGPAVVLVIACCAAAIGAATPDLLLVKRGRIRATRVRAALPATAEMLALAVVAGEAVPAALARVAAAAPGPLGHELQGALAEIRAGRTVADALDRAATRIDEPGLTTLVDAVVTALERGSPLAEVLHAQAADVRDRDRQALLAEGGRREIAMLVPVVLIILPVTVVFALYPGLVALRLGG